jgi:hypothetical protein
MLDTNEPSHDTLQNFHRSVTALGLVDAFEHKHGRSTTTTNPITTYHRGTRRLDYVYVSQSIAECITKCGYLAFHDSLDSDHCGFFMDCNAKTFFGKNDQIVPPQYRVLTSRHASWMQLYLKYLNQYLEEK